jgi:cell division protein FtsB
MVIEMKEKRIATLQTLLKEATAYGFKQNQENEHLRREFARMVREIDKLKQEV